MTKDKTFFFNGQEYSSDNDFSILDLLKYFSYSLDLIVLEHNNLICKKEDWKSITVNDKSKIEIITIVGGG